MTSTTQKATERRIFFFLKHKQRVTVHLYKATACRTGSGFGAQWFHPKGETRLGSAGTDPDRGLLGARKVPAVSSAEYAPSFALWAIQRLQSWWTTGGSRSADYPPTTMMRLNPQTTPTRARDAGGHVVLKSWVPHNNNKKKSPSVTQSSPFVGPCGAGRDPKQSLGVRAGLFTADLDPFLE